ncbi:MAG: hypothetical protein NT045_02340 [Candidatus Aureabacteria bacterium]|nr:hypothetical protein [Candidatus Auribacterota bacterium]
MIPFPGTPFYTELQEKGLLKEGAPHYPGLTREEMETMVRKAYRKFYVGLPFFTQLLRHPREMFFSRFWAYYNALKFMLWKKYIR